MSNENAPVNKTTGIDETVSIRAYAELEKELKSFKADYRNYQQAMSKKLDSLKEELREGASSEGKGGGSTDEDGSENSDILPIERLAKMKEQDENHPALPKNGRESFDRAVSIFENFGQWSKKTPKGRTITDGLKNLLETVTGTRLAWRQVYRAMDKVEEWTNGVIRHEKTRRHGHVLVAKERPSSAGSG